MNCLSAYLQRFGSIFAVFAAFLQRFSVSISGFQRKRFSVTFARLAGL